MTPGIGCPPKRKPGSGTLPPELPSLPGGYRFVVDPDGKYVIDPAGNYVIAPE